MKERFRKCIGCGIPKSGKTQYNPRCKSCASKKSAADRGLVLHKDHCPLCDTKKASSASLCLSCYKSNNYGYRRQHTEASKKKISIRLKESWATGTRLSDEGREKIRQAQFKRWATYRIRSKSGKEN